MFNDVYRGKRVLITGNTGFKGSWLALFLRKAGAELIVNSTEEILKITNEQEEQYE